MLPNIHHPIWRKIVTDEKQYEFKFFALKILMGRIKMRLEFEGGETVVEDCIQELFEFAHQYPDFVSADLKSISI